MPFYFRVNRVKVIDNREWGLWILKRDIAQVRFTSLVTTGDDDFPAVGALKGGARDAKALRDAAASVVAQVISRRTTLAIDGIKDGQTITFGDTGYVVHRSDAIPEDFNWCLLAMEDEQALRNFGQTLSTVVGSSGFDGFAQGLSVLVGASANPAFAAGTAVAKFVAEVLAAYLKGKGDEMIGALYLSLNRREHYPHGERKSDGVPDLSGNMLVDYSLFGFEATPPVPADAPPAAPRRMP
jgi:hypothetical protein